MQLELASLFLLFTCVYLKIVTLLKISLFHYVPGRKLSRAASPLHNTINEKSYKRMKATPTKTEAQMITNSRQDRNFRPHSLKRL